MAQPMKSMQSSPGGLEDLYPLSPMQEGMLFHALYGGGDDPYFRQLSCRLDGPLDRHAFEAAWQRVVDENPILRTAFYWREVDRPLQAVHRDLTVPFDYRDWSHLDRDEQERRLAKEVRDDQSRPFDPATPPLLRFRLVRLDEESHHFTWSFHHLLMDGWSVSLVLQSAVAHYRWATGVRQERPPEPGRPFRDYVAWLQDQDQDAAEDYWRRSLAGFESATPVPLGRSRTGRGESSAAAPRHLRRALPEAVASGLAATARANRLTVNTLVQGAWALILHRMSGDRDVVFGATTSGRPTDLEGFQRMVGLFINTLPVRVEVDPAAPLVDWLRRLQEREAEARQFEYTPLLDIQGVSEIPRDGSLFETVMVFENYRLQDEGGGRGERDFTIRDFSFRDATNLPLTLTVRHGLELQLRLIGDPASIGEADQEQLMGHLEIVVRALAEGLEGTVGDVPLLTEDQEARLLEAGRGAELPVPASTIPERFRAQVRRRPDAVAVVEEGHALTYGELDRRSARVARHLARRGVGGGDRVGVVMQRSTAAVIAMIAILRRGATYVPMDPEYPVDRLAYMTRVADLVAVVGRQPVLAELSLPGVAGVDVDAVAAESVDGAEPSAEVADLPDNLAYVIFTSGSTGKPKGIGIPHSALLRLVMDPDYISLHPGDRVLHVSSLSFDAAIFELWSALLMGATLEVVPREVLLSPQALAARIRRSAATTLLLTTALFNQVAHRQPTALSSLREFLFGGEAVDPTAVRMILDAGPPERILHCYGPAENTTLSTWHEARSVAADAPTVPIGLSVSNSQAYVLDRGLRPVPPGAPGELCLGGPGLAQGYVGRPGSTAAGFVPNPYGEPGSRLYRSGDLVRWNREGVLEFLGRWDDQVKLRGFRIELGEVEAALTAVGQVREAVAVIAGEGEGRYLVAYYAPATATEGELRRELHERLPPYMVPSVLVPLAELPLTPSGKVKREALPEPEAAPDVAQGEEPRGPLEELVAGIFSQVLERPVSGRWESFFELGGHSLLATRVVARLEDALGTDVPLRALFEEPSVAGLAGRLEVEIAGPREDLPPLQADAERQRGPLALAQRRLWFLQRLEPESGTYNVPTSMRLEGPLRVPALEDAFSALVRRQAVLRTRFPAPEGEPEQVLMPAARSGLPVVDLSRLGDPSAAEREGRRLRRREAGTPFDLQAEPPFRHRVLRYGEGTHDLLITLHHIVSDGWSQRILTAELSRLYAAAREGRPALLPALPVQYVDYAAWQRSWLSGETLREKVAFWSHRLAGMPPVLGLPADRPRSASPTRAAGVVPVRVPADLVAGLDELGRRRSATRFMALLAGFQVLLSRLTGRFDVPVGFPTAGRDRVEVEGLVGFFVNTLVLRGDLSGRPGFGPLVERTREMVLEAHAHQQIPFDRLAEDLVEDRTLAHPPLVQAVLALQNLPRQETVGGDLRLRRLGSERAGAKFDLTLGLGEQADGSLAGSLEYAAELFDATTVRRWIGHLVRLLRAAVRQPERPVGELPLLEPAEEHQLLVGWNARLRRSDAAPAHLDALFRRRVERTPDAVAVTGPGTALTYGELARRADRLAARLLAAGAGPEELVAVCTGRTPELAVALLGVVRAGAAYLPLDPGHPPGRLAELLEDAGVRRAVVHGRGAAVLPDGPWTRLPVHGGGDGAAVSAPPADPDRLAYVIYTSGSTGRPKGVQVTHRNVTRLMGETLPLLGADAGDVWTLFHSAAFDFSVWELWGPLLTGARLHVVPYLVSRSPGDFLELLRRQRVSVLSQTPSAFRQLVAASDGPPAALSAVVFGGEALDPAVVQPWLAGPRMLNLYGITETTVHVTWRPVTATDAARPGRSPIGPALPHLRIHLVDRHLRPVPVGVAGELLVGGDGVARGYRDRPALTAERFVPDPFSGRSGERLYRSGDLARWLPDGDVEYLGRIDHQIKIRGFRVEPGEIESLLAAHPAVREAAVLLLGEGAGARLVAYLVGDGETPAEVSVEAVREHAALQLPDHMVPTGWVTLPALPLTPNGKLDRQALAEYETEERAKAEVEPPRGPMEETLATIFADVLERPVVGRDDDFFALGGHSLLAVRVIARLGEVFCVEVPLRDLFEAPSVRDLAGRLEVALAQERDEIPPLVADPERRRAPLALAQRRLWFLQRLDPESAVYNMPATLRLEGPLSVTALTQAFSSLVERQAVLRTRFPAPHGEPEQVIESRRPRPLPVVDLSWLPAERRRAEGLHLAAAEAARAFDLETQPPFRVRLVRLAADDHLLLVSLHHIASDAWSQAILVGELSALYQAAVEGRRADLPELPVRYADYAAWQREWLSGEELEAKVDFWRRRLSGLPPVLELPPDRPRPAAPTLPAGLASVDLDAELVEGLDALGRRLSATRFMALLAAFQVLLSRLAGRRDVPVGVPTAGRDRVEVEGLVGFFVNTLVLRGDLSGDPTFGELVERTRERMLEAHAHQQVPFDRLAEELVEDRSLAHSPLVQVVLALQNVPRRDETPGDLRLRRLPAVRSAAKFDLTLSFRQRADGGLAGEVEYASELFDRSTVERWMGHLATLLECAVREPERAVRELPLLSAAERSQLRDMASGETVPLPSATADELFLRQARTRPDAVAVVEGDAALSYGELARRSALVADLLASRGVGLGQRVGLVAERSAAAVVGMLGILRRGAAYVPLDPEYPAERLVAMAEDATLAAVVGRRSTLETLALPDVPAVDLETAAAAPGEAAGTAPPPAVRHPDELAYVIFTSGSTGRPKGIGVPHRAVLRLVLDTDYVSLTAGDRMAQVSTLSFDAATFELWAALLTGASLHVVPREVTLSPAAFADRLRRSGITTLFLTTALFNQVARQRGDAFAALRDLLFGGEAVDPTTVRRVLAEGPPERLLHVYGPTENTTYSTWHRVRSVAADAVTVPIGRAISNSDAHVLDRRLCPVPLGVAGELCLGGPGLAWGYAGRSAVTAEVFVPDPYGAPGCRLYRTGDLVRWRPDGHLEFLGRWDAQVKLRGFRIELGEVEAALTACPQVREAAVVVRGEGDERHLVAYVVGAEGAVETAELRGWLQERLPSYMVPSTLTVLPELPLGATGKVDKKALPAPEAIGSQAQTAPRTPVEKAVAALWVEVLGVPEVGLEDDFFALGGHSLLAIRLTARIRETQGVELPLRQFFFAPTLGDMAREVARRRSDQVDAGPSLPTLRPEPERNHVPFPLTEVQQAYWLGRSSIFELGGVASHGYLERDLRGVDLGRLEAALQRLIRRHGMLRAVVTEDGRQRILHRVPPYRVPVHDLRGLGDGAETAARRVNQLLSHEVRPAERWPLIELRISLLPGGIMRLHLSVDALVADVWSLQALFREARALYADPDALLPPVGLSFRDYVLALEELRESEQHRRDLAYWRERLDTLPPAPDLPLAVHPAELGTPRFERRRLILAPERWQRLKTRAAAVSASPSSMLLAAFAEVLAQWSKSAHLTLNLTLFNRLPVHPDVERLVGDFTALTLVEVDHRQPAPFERRVRAVQAQLWEDLSHRTVGGVRVLRELARRRGTGPRALMPVVFTSALGIGDGGGEPPKEDGSDGGSSITQTPQVWIDHQVRERGGALVANWDAPRGLFPEGMLDDMFAAYRRLLELTSDEEDRWTESRFQLLPQTQLEERAAVNATAAPRPVGLLHGPFLEQARRRPQRPAVIHPERTLTYGELDRLSTALAHRMREHGVAPDRLVAVVMDKGWEQVVAVLAVLKAGAPYLPLEAALPEERLRRLLEVAGCDLALIQSARAELDLGPVQRIEVDTLEPPREELPALEPRQTPEDLAYVIFTSGSTGFPKGVMIEHHAALNTVVDVNREHGVGEDDRVLALSSLGFDLSVYDVFGLLAVGGALVLAEPEALRRPQRWLELARRHGVTVWNSVPALMELLADHVEREDEEPLTELRLALLSGDWIPVTLPDRIRRLAAPEVRVISMGGATEASIWSIRYPVERVEPEWSSIPYGRPMANQRFHVLDERLEPCPVWVTGDLYIGGVGLARGYFGDEEKTRHSFFEHPRSGERLYRTGDLGRYLPGGDIEFLGREDGQVKVQGHRIELGEIDAILEQHPAVRGAAAVAVGEGQERHLVAFVVPRREGPGAADDAAEPIRLPRRAPETFPSERAAGADSLDATRVSRFLGTFRRLELDGFSFPKSLYASVADLYPVRTYLVVENGTVAGLAPGAYYHHPLDHALVPVGDAAGVGAGGEDGGVTLVWTGHMESVARLFDDPALFVSIEAGSVEYLASMAAVETGLQAVPRPLAGDGDAAELRRALGLADAEVLVGALSLAPVGAGGNDGADAAAPPLVSTWSRDSSDTLEDGPLEDTLEQLEYRMSQPSIRPVPTGASPVPLPEVAPPEERFRSERTHRRFLGEPLDLPRLGAFLTPLRQVLEDDGAAAGGGLGVHLVVKQGRVGDLEAGLYAYRSQDHCLVREGSLSLEEEAFGRTNRPIYASADAALLFTSPRDGGSVEVEKATRWSGACCQALRTAAPATGVGFCPIGDLDADHLQPWLGSARLVHTAFLGRVEETELPTLEEAEGGLAAELRQHLAARLPSYMVPGRLETIVELPLSANGKVDRKALAVQGLTAARKVPRRKPRTELEKTIAGVWQEVLGVPEVGLDSGFFELGGTSILMVRVHARLQRVLGRDLTLVEMFFEHPTVETLARHLESSVEDTAGEKETAEPMGAPKGERRKRSMEVLKRQRRRRRSRRRPSNPNHGDQDE